MERQEHLEAIANGLLIEAGAIEECEAHEGTFLDLMDDDAVEKARAAGRKLIQSGDLDGDDDDLDKAIEGALSNAGEECYSCEKNRRD